MLAIIQWNLVIKKIWPLFYFVSVKTKTLVAKAANPRQSKWMNHTRLTVWKVFFRFADKEMTAFRAILQEMKIGQEIRSRKTF